MNREYYYWVKSLPLERCPSNLTNKIIRESGILNHQGSIVDRPKPHYCFTSYKLACLVTAILLLTTIAFDFNSPERIPPERLAINSICLVDSLTSNLTTAVISYGRGIDK